MNERAKNERSNEDIRYIRRNVISPLPQRIGMQSVLTTRIYVSVFFSPHSVVNLKYLDLILFPCVEFLALFRLKFFPNFMYLFIDFFFKFFSLQT